MNTRPAYNPSAKQADEVCPCGFQGDYVDEESRLCRDCWRVWFFVTLIGKGEQKP